MFTPGKKLSSRANLGSLTWCQQRVNVLTLCTKVRIQAPFHSSSVCCPKTEHHSTPRIQSHLPASQPVMPHVVRDRARRKEGAKPSNRDSLTQKGKLSCTAVTVSNSLTRQNFHTPELSFFYKRRRLQNLYSHVQCCILTTCLWNSSVNKSIYPGLVLSLRISTPNPQHTESSDLRGMHIAGANSISLFASLKMGWERKRSVKAPKWQLKPKQLMYAHDIVHQFAEQMPTANSEMALWFILLKSKLDIPVYWCLWTEVEIILYQLKISRWVDQIPSLYTMSCEWDDKL